MTATGIGVNITLSGMEQITKNLQTMQVRGQIAARQAVLRYALLIERIAKDRYVPVVTGRLKASIGGRTGPPPVVAGDALFKEKVRGDVVEVWVGTNVIYAPIIEFGRNPANHRSSAVREAFRTDVASTRPRHGTNDRRKQGSGRHGAFLGPAMRDAQDVGAPIVAAELRDIMRGRMFGPRG